jgi:hypothetical protein
MVVKGNLVDLDTLERQKGYNEPKVVYKGLTGILRIYRKGNQRSHFEMCVAS